MRSIRGSMRNSTVHSRMRRAGGGLRGHLRSKQDWTDVLPALEDKPVMGANAVRRAF
jgi:hypothetical protein